MKRPNQAEIPPTFPHFLVGIFAGFVIGAFAGYSLHGLLSPKQASEPLWQSEEISQPGRMLPSETEPSARPSSPLFADEELAIPREDDELSAPAPSNLPAVEAPNRPAASAMGLEPSLGRPEVQQGTSSDDEGASPLPGGLRLSNDPGSAYEPPPE